MTGPSRRAPRTARRSRCDSRRRDRCPPSSRSAMRSAIVRFRPRASTVWRYSFDRLATLRTSSLTADEVAGRARAAVTPSAATIVGMCADSVASAGEEARMATSAVRERERRVHRPQTVGFWNRRRYGDPVRVCRCSTRTSGSLPPAARRADVSRRTCDSFTISASSSRALTSGWLADSTPMARSTSGMVHSKPAPQPHEVTDAAQGLRRERVDDELRRIAGGQVLGIRGLDADRRAGRHEVGGEQLVELVVGDAAAPEKLPHVRQRILSTRAIW